MAYVREQSDGAAGDWTEESAATTELEVHGKSAELAEALVRRAIHVVMAHRRAGGGGGGSTSSPGPHSDDDAPRSIAWALDWATFLLSGRPFTATCQLLSSTPGPCGEPPPTYRPCLPPPPVCPTTRHARWRLDAVGPGDLRPSAKLIERCSDGVGDQGAEEALWGQRYVEGSRDVLEAVSRASGFSFQTRRRCTTVQQVYRGYGRIAHVARWDSLTLLRTGGIVMPCGKRWGIGDHAWRCKTCELDPSCAICLDCFRLGDHDGHDISMIPTENGCCDCGDLEAWREEGCCVEHSPAHSRGAVKPLPATMRPTTRGVVYALMTEWATALEELQRVRLCVSLRRATFLPPKYPPGSTSGNEG